VTTATPIPTMTLPAAWFTRRTTIGIRSNRRAIRQEQRESDY
jgi:hypothetical protein